MLSAPEWLPDPTGRHALRWWDGACWSTAVSDGSGAQADDPLPGQPPPAVAVAGWYADSSGRHRLRYWTGVRWGDAVSDGGPVADDPAPADVPPPPATPAAWHPDPAGSGMMRWWDGAEWYASVVDRKGQLRGSPADPTWPPPGTDRLAPPHWPGFRAARKAGWHMGAHHGLKVAGHDTCPRCGGALHVTEVSRPGRTIEYTPETTDLSYPPCERCGFVPPWSQRAGLYADPGGVHEYRYWSGEAWTDEVADGGEGASDPLVMPA